MFLKPKYAKIFPHIGLEISRFVAIFTSTVSLALQKKKKNASAAVRATN